MVTPPRSEPTTGASDGYVAEVLQRLARARTNLVLAERAVVRPQGPDLSPNSAELVEAARVDLLWATASAIVAPDSERSRRRLGEARERLADLLDRLGYDSYAAFSEANPVDDDSDDPRLRDARAEFEAAAGEWEGVQARLLDADRGVIDLTTDELP